MGITVCVYKNVIYMYKQAEHTHGYKQYVYKHVIYICINSMCINKPVTLASKS